MAVLNKKEYTDKMADNLPMLRAKMNYTQDDLSQLIGVSRHTIISIENLKRPMTWNTYLSLVFVFSNNPETKLLLDVMGIVDKEVEDFIMPRKKSKG